MVMAFASGVMVTMVAYPRLVPCPDLASSCARAAVSRCPACPMSAVQPDTAALVAKAVEQAVARCPTCPKCPDFPGCPSCPANQQCPPTVPCPSCSLNCPQVRSARVRLASPPCAHENERPIPTELAANMFPSC